MWRITGLAFKIHSQCANEAQECFCFIITDPWDEVFVWGGQCEIYARGLCWGGGCWKLRTLVEAVWLSNRLASMRKKVHIRPYRRKLACKHFVWPCLTSGHLFHHRARLGSRPQWFWRNLWRDHPGAKFTWSAFQDSKWFVGFSKENLSYSIRVSETV